MVKQLRVVTGSDSAPGTAVAVLRAKGAQRVSASAGWKKLGRASGLFTVGLLAAVGAPRDAKAIGYFADNTANAIPPNGVVCPESSKGCYTSWMAIVDIDNDGAMDQVWANGGAYYAPGTVAESTVVRNNGLGVFSDITPTAFGGAVSRLRQESVADVNGDGMLDIYQPGGFGMDLDKLWIQTSPGVFSNQAATLLPAGLMSHASSSHMGDLDGDGDIDILVMDWGIGLANTIDRAIIYTNDGTGKFTFAGMQNDPVFATPTDMLPETIPASGNAPPGSTAANYTLATASAGTGSTTYWGVRPIDVDLVDVDNDFDLDIMVDHRNGFSRIFLNDGHGHFTDGTNFKLTTSADGLTQTVSSNWPLKRGPYVYNQEFCDIDEDGDLDMLLDNVGPKPINNQSWAPGGGTTGTIDVSQLAINDGHGKFTDDTVNRIIGELGGDDNAVKCADFNGDGHYDLVVATLSGRSEKFLLNDGTAHFTMVGDAIPVVADSSLAIDAADLNGDKIMDLVTGSGESGNNWVNRVYLGGGPSVPDHTPPAFRAIQAPVPLPDTPTVIRYALRDAATSEVGQMVKSTSVTYSVGGGTTKTVKGVFYGGDLFRATIPAQPAGTVVSVTLSAVDRANLTGTAALSFTVPQDNSTQIGAGGAAAGGTGGTAAGGTGGTAAGGTGGTAIGAAGVAGTDEVAGAAGEAPTETGGAAGKGGASGKGGAGGKAGSGGTSKAGATSGGESGDAAGETGTAGGTHTTSSDDGGCAISASTPANKSTGAVMLGFGLAMLGLVRRRRNSK